MRHLPFLLLLCIVSLHKSHAQLHGLFTRGARSGAMSGVSVSLNGPWSLFGNPAGISEINTLTTFAGFSSSFHFMPFNQAAAGILIPNQLGTSAIGFSRFGNELFNTQLFVAAFAKKISAVQLGLSSQLLQYSIEGIGKRSVFVVDMGAQIELSSQFRLGVTAHNLSQSLISTETQERLASVIVLGLVFQPSKQLSAFLELEKNTNTDPSIRMGLEYFILPRIVLRTGIHPRIRSHSFGLGLRMKSFEFDYALVSSQSLGNRHEIGLIYQLKNQK